MESVLQSLFGLHVHSCPHWLRHHHSHHPQAFGLIYEDAIGQPRQTTSLFDPLVTEDRNGRGLRGEQGGVVCGGRWVGLPFVAIRVTYKYFKSRCPFIRVKLIVKIFENRIKFSMPNIQF
jgi:hypothetical protein